MATITLEPLNPVAGAVVSGVDLTQDLDDTVIGEIRQALLDHHVIFFRDQDLAPDEHIAFGRRFGELHVHPAAEITEGAPELLRIHADENSKGVAGQGWHSDVSCEPEPPAASILLLHEVPATGGDTMFANSHAAFDALSLSMQQFLTTLTATHSGKHVFDRGGYREDRNYPEAVHPMVLTHPESGKQGLFVNSGFTTRINELSRSESDALLSFLYQHLSQPQFTCRFNWSPNSIAFWDNRSVQHLAIWDYYPEVRSGWRVTLNGDKPFYDPDGKTGEHKRSMARLQNRI